MSSTSSEFSVRIVVCDHYLVKPVPGLDVIYSDFRGSDIKQVPVLRIFGPSSDGHKTCLHIHGVFPYFYLPCPTPNPEPQLLYQLAVSLDKALNIALKQATSVSQHVYKITLVKGLPFYGFHDKDHLYLKVFLYSPNLIKQAVELCSNGAILGQTFQPHESHLNFTLQFFIDFNLFGMSNIDLQKVIFRKTGISQNSSEPAYDLEQNILKPESICFYEADCIASHIINRQRIGKGDGIENPGLEEVWKQEIERRKQLNMSMASKSLSQGRINSQETDSHYKFEQIFLIKLSGDVDKPVEINNKDNIEQIYYPAESLEGTQLLDAVDVSMHLPENSYNFSMNETVKPSSSNTILEDTDNTIVDENLALNSSLSICHSQVMLNSEDLDLVDMLQDMDEKPVEDGSIVGTPAVFDPEVDSDADDIEYSQVFKDETLVTNMFKHDEDSDNNSPTWNDSFWEGVNIPQLDGTFDDDHVKKVRKRKMRPLRLGLSKPKEKKNLTNIECNGATSKLDLSGTDEINTSQETVTDISREHLKKCIKVEPQSIIESTNSDNFKVSKEESEGTLIDLVEKFCVKNEYIKAETYDERNNFIPEAGTSTNFNIKSENTVVDTLSDQSVESSPDDKTFGIKSFYDISKIFDFSDDNVSSNTSNKSIDIDENQSNSPRKSFKTTHNAITLTPKFKPPTLSDITSSLKRYNIPFVKNPEPFYSNPSDVGDKVELGQVLLKLQGNVARDQKPFENVLDTTSIEEWRQLLFLQSNEMTNECSKPASLIKILAGNRQCILQPVAKAPTTNTVRNSLIKNESTEIEKVNIDPDGINSNMDDLDDSQALGLNYDTPDISQNVTAAEASNSFQITMQPDGSFLCFGNGDLEKSISSQESILSTHEFDYLTLMLTEVHTKVRGDLHPDPAIDAIQAIFVMVSNDCPPDSFLTKSIISVIIVDTEDSFKYLQRCVFGVHITYVNNEIEIFEKILELVTKHDPDIICGYEMEMNSWGYIMERAQLLGLEIVKEVSRITEKSRQKRWRSEENEFEGRVIGRVTLNVWRLFRHELALSSYSFENCMYEILKERVPKYSYAQLHKWWDHESRTFRWIPVEYYMTKLKGTVRMLEKLDIINRTSELARLFGLQWWEVLSRGSQFRVESLMLRAARPLNLIALSPTVRQRAAMRAPECLPLIFEPESRFYSDPVIVLDFQSLYPSMMIAYNYCFSTCIGRVQNIIGDTAYEFGAWRLKIPRAKLEKLVKNGLVHWSPVGVGFVKSSVRRGVLPAMLRRILAARQAVKKSMKLQTDESIKKAMHSRQLGLKLIANVTYGYTAANFSGRMPCVEVGDSVVAKGRETLERAIKLVRDSKQWNAKVVYGDTDSMFVLVPGATRATAFEIGQQIADAVTADNPSPVALKLEKVYQPCILQTKKRYVGFMYETPDQEKPVYEAKGIETVRRDGCPASVKLLKESLCELFTSGDMSPVKRRAQAVLSRLAAGTLPLPELVLTREYRGPDAYRAAARAPPAEIAKRIAARDHRAVPRVGERVSWIVCAGPAHAPLWQLARTGDEVVRSGAVPHAAYYAARALLPPLQRCISLLGADAARWWQELGYSRVLGERQVFGGIAKYMERIRCSRCGQVGRKPGGRHATVRQGLLEARQGQENTSICESCGPVANALSRYYSEETFRRTQCDTICRSCMGHRQVETCVNMECPVFWRKHSANLKMASEEKINSHISNETIDF